MARGRRGDSALPQAVMSVSVEETEEEGADVSMRLVERVKTLYVSDRFNSRSALPTAARETAPLFCPRR